MSKNNKLSESTQQQAVAEAERVVVELQAKRDAHVERGRELDERRKSLSYAAHVQHDPASRKTLDALNEEVAKHGSELQSLSDAIGEAAQRLWTAQQAQAREHERSAIMEDQKRSKEFRELGPFLDKATDNLRRGLMALKKNAASVGKDFRHVQTLHRVLSVALFDTPFRDAFGVPDANDRRTFATFSGVINQWCNSRDANLQHELQALDGEQTKTTEAAMPQVLTRLRVDEISAVTKGAGEGTRIVLMKRDAPRRKAFGYAMGKGGNLPRRHWLSVAHDPELVARGSNAFSCADSAHGRGIAAWISPTFGSTTWSRMCMRSQQASYGKTQRGTNDGPTPRTNP